MLRAREVDDTLKILEPLIIKASITRLANLTELDNTSSLYVYSAIRPSAKSISVSMGKSLEISSAKCGAIVESFETFLAEEVKPDKFKISTFNLLRNKIAITGGKNQRCVFSDKYDLNWNIGYELGINNDVYIPSFLISLDSNILINQIWGSNSDGIASGNTFEEALVFSLFEQIERIAIKHNKRQRLYFDDKLLDNYHIDPAYDFKFYMYENDFKIPVVGAEIFNKSKYTNQCVYVGCSSSYSYEAAMKRAVEEALQSKVGTISGARDDLTELYYSSTNILKMAGEKLCIEPLYPDLKSRNIKDAVDELKLIISNLEKKIIIYEYFNNNFVVLRTYIVDCENNIL